MRREFGCSSWSFSGRWKSPNAISRLRRDNAALREALERIFLMDKCPMGQGDGCPQCIAREALAKVA